MVALSASWILSFFVLFLIYVLCFLFFSSFTFWCLRSIKFISLWDLLKLFILIQALIITININVVHFTNNKIIILSFDWFGLCHLTSWLLFTHRSLVYNKSIRYSVTQSVLFVFVSLKIGQSALKFIAQFVRL